MIAKLRGFIDQTGESYVVMDVNGVGYLVFCSKRTLNMLSKEVGEVSLKIETHVREDHIHLFGFFDEVEREWFNTLITVQGVGAKVCLAMLSVLPPDDLMQAIAAQDRAAITKSPGVGPKLAARIITELRDKIEDMALRTATIPVGDKTGLASGSNQIIDDAISALVNLGYGRSDAFRVVHQSAAKIENDVSVEKLIKEGLVELSSNG